VSDLSPRADNWTDELIFISDVHGAMNGECVQWSDGSVVFEDLNIR
jgi:hypothetical protein